MLRPLALALLIAILALSGGAWADVVISEIMYHPDSHLELDEFLELTNTGHSPVNLTGWGLTGGITFAFPGGTLIPPGERLVVCRDEEAFCVAHSETACLGNWSGRLSNGGERINLVDHLNSVVDTVQYSDEEPWSPRADGDGQSLECIALDQNNDTPRNWRASHWGTPGTPGLQNTVASDGLPPLLTSLTHSPTAPAPGSPITVTVFIQGSVQTVRLYLSTGSIIPMGDNGTAGDVVSGDGVWSAQITAPAAGERLSWWIQATDPEDRVSRAPEYAPLERRGLFIPPTDEPSDLPVWRLWLDPEDLEEIIEESGCDDLCPAGLAVGGLYIEPVWVRLRGATSREFPKPNWKIFLPEWWEFQDEQTFNLNSGYTDLSMMREILAQRLFESMGHLGSHTDPVRLMINGEYQGVHARVENINRRWLSRRDLSLDGALFAAREGLFQPADMSELQRRFESENDRPSDESWEPLLAAIDFINSNPGSDEAWAAGLGQHFDIDALFDFLAIRACLQAFDDKNKNLFLYRDPAVERWIPIPTDLDLSLGRMWLPVEPDGLLNDILVTDLPSLWSGFPPVDNNPLYQRISEIPALRDEVHRRIANLLAGDFRLSVIGPQIDDLHSQILQAGLEDPLRRGTDEQFLNGANELREFVRLRRESLATEIPASLLTVSDVQLLDHLLGIEPLVGNEWTAADHSGDGMVDVADLVRLIDPEP